MRACLQSWALNDLNGLLSTFKSQHSAHRQKASEVALLLMTNGVIRFKVHGMQVFARPARRAKCINALMAIPKSLPYNTSQAVDHLYGGDMFASLQHKKQLTATRAVSAVLALWYNDAHD